MKVDHLLETFDEQPDDPFAAEIAAGIMHKQRDRAVEAYRHFRQRFYDSHPDAIEQDGRQGPTTIKVDVPIVRPNPQDFTMIKDTIVVVWHVSHKHLIVPFLKQCQAYVRNILHADQIYQSKRDSNISEQFDDPFGEDQLVSDKQAVKHWESVVQQLDKERQRIAKRYTTFRTMYWTNVRWPKPPTVGNLRRISIKIPKRVTPVIIHYDQLVLSVSDEPENRSIIDRFLEQCNEFIQRLKRAHYHYSVARNELERLRPGAQE
jgi:hypothetical protein